MRTLVAVCMLPVLEDGVERLRCQHDSRAKIPSAAELLTRCLSVS